MVVYETYSEPVVVVYFVGLRDPAEGGGGHLGVYIAEIGSSLDGDALELFFVVISVFVRLEIPLDLFKFCF